MLEKHAKKGRLVYVSGKLQTRKWRKDGEDSDRFSTRSCWSRAAESSSWIAERQRRTGEERRRRAFRRDRRDGG